jgi:cation/acetate symporter
MMSRFLLAAIMAALPFAALAQTAPPSPSRNPNWIAIGMFMIIVVTTLVVTYRSAGRTRSKSDFYTVGHGITPLPNDLAIAGDFLSAAAFLSRNCGHERI